MISIQKLELEDFQTHRKTTIELSPNFNVIVGCTRSGKSSVVRALDFLFYNNWYEDYQRFDTPHASITATLSNGKIITRTKSDRLNKIAIKTSSNIERFESFGLTLPPEAIAALGVLPIDIGTKDSIPANVANQDDPLFLLYSTGTDRTKILSRLSGLHWIDYALKDLNKDRREKTSEVHLLQEANEQLLSKLKTFKNLSNLRESLKCIQDKSSALSSLQRITDTGTSLVEKMRRWKLANQELQKLKTINYQVAIPRLERIIQLKETTEKLAHVKDRLSTIDVTLATLQSQIQRLRTSVNTVESEIRQIPICPECGQESQQEIHHEQKA